MLPFSADSQKLQQKSHISIWHSAFNFVHLHGRRCLSRDCDFRDFFLHSIKTQLDHLYCWIMIINTGSMTRSVFFRPLHLQWTDILHWPGACIYCISAASAENAVYIYLSFLSASAKATGQRHWRENKKEPGLFVFTAALFQGLYCSFPS